MTASRHIPYLSYHKAIIREICRPQKDDLLILAKGLGMRRIVCALLKTYDRKEDLVLVVNATPADEAGIGDELGIMGVRSPGFRVLTHELSVDKRAEMYKRGGLFSVTSKILVHDFLRETVPANLITGLVILHAEKVSHASQEEFAIRLYRRKNTSGFCKAFSDEPEMFAHGISPLKDMLINLNMTSVMIWPRYNEGVKVALATRQAEVVEMYQPMTELMRQCQDAITECMEAMLVELKRDHTLNLDLEDLNVRNAQFKSFDTMVKMRLKPVWHKVGAKTRIHVAALTELRNLQTWLLEYDSATFASYINTLHRQFFLAQKIQHGSGRHMHDWFNAKAATLLVEGSQARVSKRKMVMDNSPEPEHSARNDDDSANGGVDIDDDNRQFEDEEEALRDISMEGGDDDDEIMEAFATQTQTVRQQPAADDNANDGSPEDEDDELRDVADAPPPPVFRPMNFDIEAYLTASVTKRIRKGHEAVLEEQPKWSLLAKVLKEVEDTIARVSETHADAPGTNIVLVMCASDRTCLQLRQYLTTMQKTDPPFGPHAGKRMMESLFLSNWQHEQNGAHRMRGRGGDELKHKDEMELAKKARDSDKDKYGGYNKNRGKQPSYKRRRLRGGATMPGRQSNADMEREQREALMKAQSAFGGAAAASESSNGNESGDAVQTNGANVSNGANQAGQASGTTSPPLPADPGTSLMMSQGVIEDDMDDAQTRQQLMEMGLYEDFETNYGLLPPDNAVIIRPYGGEDDDILLQELRPRFVVMYEPNLPFIRRLEVYKNCNPGLALRVYQMTYTNSFEEDRFLSTMSREAEAFKKLIEDRSSMVIPIYNNNPRVPMRDHVNRSKTTYSSRNAGGGENAEAARILVDIREMGAILPSLIDDAGIKVVPLTLTVGDYILSPKMCVERKALPDLESSLANGRLHSQCEAMTAHYEICILLIEFEEDKFGLRTQADAKRESAGKSKEEEDWRDTFYLQAKVSLLALTFPRLRIIWSSSPYESVKILSDLKLNFDEPDELSAMMKGQTDVPTLRDTIENPGAVEMLRAIPGISGHNLRLVMSKVEGIQELVGMKRAALRELIGEKNGDKVWRFLHLDSRRESGYHPEVEPAVKVGRR